MYPGKMIIHYTLRIFLLILLSLRLTCVAFGQDTERPISPDLKVVSVNPLTGNASLAWQLSPSADVAAYIIYINKNF